MRNLFSMPGYFELSSKSKIYLALGLYSLGVLVNMTAYPDPFFTGDSGSYVFSAITLQPNGVRPIGYSWFLASLHFISSTIYLITITQYLILFTALLTFYLVADSLLQLSSWQSLTFNLVTFCTPSLIYLGNTITSDSLFVSLTFFWIATLGLILKQKSYPLVAIHFVITAGAILTRYIGLFYPLISTVILVIVYRRKALRILPFLALLLLLIISFTRNQMHQRFGIKTFEEFSGWSIANNATSIIPHIDLDPDALDDPQLRNVHRIILTYPRDYYATQNVLSSKFLWSNDYPGKAIQQYVSQTNSPNQEGQYIRNWLITGKLLNRYGWYLIRKYPAKYFRHFIIPNTGNVFIPDNNGSAYSWMRSENPEAQLWYNIDVRTFRPKWDYYSKWVLPVAPYYNLCCWLLLAISLIRLWHIRNDSRITSLQARFLLVIGLYVIFYSLSSILAHPVILRYTVLIPTMLLIFPIIAFLPQNQNRSQEE